MRPVLITNPRSGTHYLKNLIATILGDPPIEREYATARELADTMSASRSTQLIYGHLHYSSFATVLDQRVCPDLGLILLTRNPLDRLISQLAFTRALGGKLPDSKRTPQQLARELLLGEWDGRPWEDGWIVTRYADRHNYYLRELFTDWFVNRDCFVIKFEELIMDPIRILAELFDFLKSPARLSDIRNAVESINFATLSNGRQPGQPDPTSHYRRGVPGEWRQVFSVADINLMRPRYAAEFRAAGYEL